MHWHLKPHGHKKTCKMHEVAKNNMLSRWKGGESEIKRTTFYAIQNLQALECQQFSPHHLFCFAVSKVEMFFKKNVC